MQHFVLQMSYLQRKICARNALRLLRFSFVISMLHAVDVYAASL
jgi:hypothetical protein